MRPGIKVVSDEEAARADFSVCVPWSTPTVFYDDMRGTCSKCGVAVRYRPYMPKRPPKLCMPCFVTRVADGELS